MKRQIYVPFSLIKDGKMPEEAVSLSQSTQLGVQMGKEEDHLYAEVCVIEIPEKRVLSYRKQVSSGFIQPIEYLDEFCVFDKTTQLELRFPCGKTNTPKPRIKERHMLSYKERFYDKGEYVFSITTKIDGKIENLTEGLFEVI
jgi:hypothetical protein